MSFAAMAKPRRRRRLRILYATSPIFGIPIPISGSTSGARFGSPARRDLCGVG